MIAGLIVYEMFFLLVGIVAVLVAIIHFFNTLLRVRWYVRQVDKVLSKYPVLEQTVAATYTSMTPDQRSRLADAADMFCTGMDYAEYMAHLVDKALRGRKAGRVRSPELVEIEALEADIRQPQKYHAVQLPSGWAVAYIEQGSEQIACLRDNEIDARRTAVAKNLALQNDVGLRS